MRKTTCIDSRGVFLLLLIAASSGCAIFCSDAINKPFVRGIEAAFFSTKMADEYEAYVNADPALDESGKVDRIDRVSRLRVLVGNPKETIVADVKHHMIAKQLCDQYDEYIDADPKLKATSKKIRKGSSAKIRELIVEAEQANGS